MSELKYSRLPGPQTEATQRPPGESYTLEPLRAEGHDALTPDDADEVLKVKLRRLETVSPDGLHEVTIRIADDLFRYATTAGALNSLFPAGVELLRATFAFLFKDSPGPHAVELAPPATLVLQYPADAPRVMRFLSRHHFTTAAALLMAVFLVPAWATDETDADDDERRAHDDSRFTHSALRTRHSALALSVPFLHTLSHLDTLPPCPQTQTLSTHRARTPQKIPGPRVAKPPDHAARCGFPSRISPPSLHHSISYELVLS